MKKIKQKSISTLLASAACLPFLLVLATCGKSNPTEVKALNLEQTLATMSTKDEVAKACDKFEDERIERRKAMIELQKQYPPFRIQGDIKDNDPNSVQVWGVAFIPPQTGVQHWANSHAQRNIVVLNPKNEVGNPSYYSGLHWFVNKETGRNGFGADVPVWVFGPPPDEIKKAIAAGDVLNANQRVCIKRWKELEAAQTEKPSASQAGMADQPQVATTAPPPKTTLGTSEERSSPLSNDEKDKLRISPPVATPVTEPAATQPVAEKSPSEADVLRKYKASFDCGKASTAIERLICSTPSLSQLDGLLGSTNKDRMSNPAFGVDSTVFRADGRSWLKKRDSCTDAACLEKTYRARIAELCEMPVIVGVHPVGDCDAIQN